MNRKTIVISKQGSSHTFEDKNNQDFAFNFANIKMVLDGCGSCDFSEVGTRLFAQIFLEKIKDFSKNNIVISESNFLDVVKEIFQRLTQIEQSDEFYYKNFCFTILACIELEDSFCVLTCGDGYIVANKGGSLEVYQLDDGEYPKYYIYNFIKNKENLLEYKEGVNFTVQIFSKGEYENVGVATDGMRFVEKLDTIEKNRLEEFMLAGKKGKIGMLINRNHTLFKDDISICF